MFASLWHSESLRPFERLTVRTPAPCPIAQLSKPVFAGVPQPDVAGSAIEAIKTPHAPAPVPRTPSKPAHPPWHARRQARRWRQFIGR